MRYTFNRVRSSVLLLSMCLWGCGDDDGVQPPVPDCGVDQDHDRDGYGPGCRAGEDCDDAAPGVTGACNVDGWKEGARH